jgi:dephospho-CoA kinase
VVVHAPVEIRRARALARGMSAAAFAARVAAQVSDEERLAHADVVLDGSGSVAALESQVDDWLDSMTGEQA